MSRLGAMAAAVLGLGAGAAAAQAQAQAQATDVIAALKSELERHQCLPAGDGAGFGERAARSIQLFNLMARDTCASIDELPALDGDPDAGWTLGAEVNVFILQSCGMVPACGEAPAPDMVREYTRGCWFDSLGEMATGEIADWSGACDAQHRITGPGRLSFSYPEGASDSDALFVEANFEAGALGTGRITVEQVGGTREVAQTVDGLLHGTSRITFSDGGLGTGPYVNGLFEGEWSFVYGDGVVAALIFEAGVPVRGDIDYTGADGSPWQSYSGGLDAEFLFHGTGELVLADGSVQSGEFVAGVFQGSAAGVITLGDGSSYEGETRNGQPHGQGTWTFPNGDVYIGTVMNGELTGTGRFTFAAGGSYVGEVRQALFQGQGRWVLSNGDVYEGGFAAGSPHGRGRLDFAAGGYYEGDYVRGQATGQGTQEFGDGTLYRGAFLDGEPHGQGVFDFPNGNTYEGGVRAGELSGQGTERLANGDVFDGQFANNTRNGPGRLVFADGTILTGNWQDGLASGPARITFPDGGAISATFVAGNLEGPGVETFADGRRYEGDFANGQWNGQGTLTFPDGNSFSGTFVDGVPDGLFVEQRPSPSGLFQTICVRFDNGQFVEENAVGCF